MKLTQMLPNTPFGVSLLTAVDATAAKTLLGLTNPLSFKGSWNASTNTPTLANGVGTSGDMYIVSVAGTTSLDGYNKWGVGDQVIFGVSTWTRIEGGSDLGIASATSLALGGATIGSNALAVTGTSLFTGQVLNATNGALSTPAALFTGTWITGGTATTNKPFFLIETTGATSNAWNTSGTGLGINAASGFAGLAIDYQFNGITNFSVRGNDGKIINAGAIQQGNGGICLGSAATGAVTTVSGGYYGWSSNSTTSSSSIDTFITRPAAAVIHLGAADAATATAQTFGVQGIVAGTSNTAGANFIIAGSQSTGTGVGGAITFQVSLAGSTGTAQNALTTAMTIVPYAAIAQPGVYIGSTSAQNAGDMFALTGNRAGIAGMTIYNSNGTSAASTVLYIGNQGLGVAAANLALNNHNNTTGNGIDSLTLSVPAGFFLNNTASWTAASGAQYLFGATATVNQSGTASADMIRIAPTVTAKGSGGLNLLHGLAGAAGTTEVFSITDAGLFTTIGGVVAGTITATGAVGDLNAASARFIGWTSRSYFQSPSDGVISLFNNATTDFSRLQFGGTTSSFPAIKRSTTSLQGRLADDSAFCAVQGKLTTDTNYTAGVQVPTGYITIYDAAGTAYKVSCNV